MKKISYKNKEYKSKAPVSGPLPSDIGSDEDYSANAPGIGRGLSMPGEKAIPLKDTDESRVFLKKKEPEVPPPDHKRMLDLFVDLADNLDKSGEHELASFADFLISKIAQQRDADYEALLKDLIVKISNSDLLKKNNLMIKVGRLYNEKFLSLYDELGEQAAHREAYQSAFELVEQELGV
jgi:hypothetical protein